MNFNYMQQGEVKWIGPLIKSKKKGYFRIVTLRIMDESHEQSKVYLNPENKNYKKWEPLLKVGNILKGLIWMNQGNGLIDADSPVELV